MSQFSSARHRCKNVFLRFKRFFIFNVFHYKKETLANNIQRETILSDTVQRYVTLLLCLRWCCRSLHRPFTPDLKTHLFQKSFPP